MRIQALLIGVCLVVFSCSSEPEQTGSDSSGTDAKDQVADFELRNKADGPAAQVVQQFLQALKSDNEDVILGLVIASEREEREKITKQGGKDPEPDQSNATVVSVEYLAFDLLHEKIDGDDAHVIAFMKIKNKMETKDGKDKEWTEEKVIRFILKLENGEWKLALKQSRPEAGQKLWLDDPELPTPQKITFSIEARKKFLAKVMPYLPDSQDQGDLEIVDFPILRQNRRSYFVMPPYHSLGYMWNIATQSPGLGEDAIRNVATCIGFGVFELVQDQKKLVHQCEKNGYLTEASDGWVHVFKSSPDNSGDEGSPARTLVGAFHDNLYFQVTNEEKLKELKNASNKPSSTNSSLSQLIDKYGHHSVLWVEYQSERESKRWKHSAKPVRKLLYIDPPTRLQSLIYVVYQFENEDDALDVAEEMREKYSQRPGPYDQITTDGNVVLDRSLAWSDPRDTRQKLAWDDLSCLRKAVSLFAKSNGRLPTDAEGLSSCLHFNDREVMSLAGLVPQDPWGRPYRYELKSNGEASIFSAGPDGIAGTEDEANLDLRTNVTLKEE